MKPIEVTALLHVDNPNTDVSVLVHEYGLELDRSGHAWEMVFVLDGVERSVLPALKQLQQDGHNVQAISLQSSHGESVAFAAGARWRTTEEKMALLEKVGFVDLETAQTLTVHARYAEEAVEELEAELNFDKMAIGFNVTYLLDALTIRRHKGTVAGLVVAICGDVDEDGFADVIVGAPGDDGAGTDLGRAVVESAAADLSRLRSGYRQEEIQEALKNIEASQNPSSDKDIPSSQNTCEPRIGES